MTLLERFMDKVEKTETCWLWKGSKNNYGYGSFMISRKIRGAHRASYELFKGNIPKGLTIDHLCRIRHCVNPEHLEIATIKVNVLRGIGLCAVNANKENCPNGHPYLGDNLYLHKYKNGSINRRCICCMKNTRKKYYEKLLLDKVRNDRRKQLMKIISHEWYKKNREAIIKRRKEKLSCSQAE